MSGWAPWGSLTSVEMSTTVNESLARRAGGVGSAVEQADEADKVRDGWAARPLQLVRSVGRIVGEP
jgi:hypothetical protein